MGEGSGCPGRRAGRLRPGPTAWKPLAAGSGSGNPRASGHVFGVEGVRFVVCDRASGRGVHHRAYLS
ncbi:hypothetical protein [Streptomyces thermolilacinus]|uniref:hypothetical protein n=1 Tax=Streptomyces thermolilacinus TaxID=285540 RepID=UPI0033CA69E8